MVKCAQIMGVYKYYVIIEESLFLWEALTLKSVRVHERYVSTTAKGEGGVLSHDVNVGSNLHVMCSLGIDKLCACLVSLLKLHALNKQLFILEFWSIKKLFFTVVTIYGENEKWQVKRLKIRVTI